MWSALFDSHGICLIIILLVVIDIIGSIKLINSKYFVSLITCRIIERGSNCVLYDIPEAFSTMRLGVEVRKLHIIYCVHHYKCFSEIQLIDSSDKDVGRSILVSYSVLQYFYNCCLVIII